MTKMSEEEVMSAIKKGAKKLNDALELGLNEETYIKSKGFQNSKVKKKLKPPLDPKMKRNENDVSFNYSRSEFKFESTENTN